MISVLSLVSVGLLCVGLGGAFPTLGLRKVRDVDDGLLATLNLMEQYASAAYCRSNFASPGDKVRCDGGACPLVNASNATSIIEYNSELATDVTGYVAVDTKYKLIIVAFRGSSSLDNWLADFNFQPVTTGLCPKCTAHMGFWQSWLDAKPDVVNAVKKLYAAYPGYRIVTTGHSLGGAISTLAAADLRHSGYPVTMYSFGAPRVSSSVLANYITAQPGGNYRVTHYNDPVPNIPLIIMDFAHVSPEYYIDKPNNQAVKAKDIKVYEGIMSLKGNARWHLFADAAAHLWYFEKVTGKCSK